MRLKEQYKEIVCGFNDERTENVANRCAEIAEEFTIRFMTWYEEETEEQKIEIFRLLLKMFKEEDDRV